ncbi:hypothetical protein [Runella slithyformis]|uniref:Outer membrane protein beta-barrel domain-containing protein n=1 Tax=Runella slithyformis (strain ATCC 29530 / DSM 19594 / LMG 11500 / NCIMB 11436 / LSU 4) TaxID=761193 RepID=A0A7U4E5T2_RUNSL|nr:hypothetical protein [Runella slithyformis]AEI48523.1 hypothetical protein Runsl_2109 [Runella slithyformis DSM 19594]
MSAIFKSSFSISCIFCFCLLQTNAKAQATDSLLRHKWGVEIGYGPTTTLRVDGNSIAWRPQIGVVYSHTVGRKNTLSYGLSYRTLATNLLNGGSTNINFLSASVSCKRLVLRDKIIIGAGVLSEYKLREYTTSKASDGTNTKNPPPSGFDTYRSINWGGIITCQVPIKLSKKLSLRTGITYSFTVPNFVSARLLNFAGSYPAGLFLTTGLYF